MTLAAALSEISPGESCLFTLRVHKCADGRIASTIYSARLEGGQKHDAQSLAGLVAMATRDRETSEVDEVLNELETVMP